MIRDLIKDAVELARNQAGHVSPRTLARALAGSDSFAVTGLTRARELARRLHVPGINFLLRTVQTAFYGIEIDKKVTLGHGVWFVHPLGTVVGGDSRVGDRVRFLGNNTVGTVKDNGYPVIEDDVLVGCGARILGPIRVGACARGGPSSSGPSRGFRGRTITGRGGIPGWQR